MYENGKRVNRYAAKVFHRNRLKKNHTPRWYSSYDIYCQERQNFEDSLMQENSWYAERRKKRLINGYKQYFEKWWKGYSGIYAGSWKKTLKREDHRKCRSFYRQEIHKAMMDEDADIYIQKKFEDDWKYT